MNMVERFFRDLSQQAILPGSFGSVAELVDTINLYLAQHNLEPNATSGMPTAKKFSTKYTEHGKRPPIRQLLNLFKRRCTRRQSMI
jgi:hypothetical protein